MKLTSNLEINFLVMKQGVLTYKEEIQIHLDIVHFSADYYSNECFYINSL